MFERVGPCVGEAGRVEERCEDRPAAVCAEQERSGSGARRSSQARQNKRQWPQQTGHTRKHTHTHARAHRAVRRWDKRVPPTSPARPRRARPDDLTLAPAAPLPAAQPAEYFRSGAEVAGRRGAQGLDPQRKQTSIRAAEPRRGGGRVTWGARLAPRAAVAGFSVSSAARPDIIFTSRQWRPPYRQPRPSPRRFTNKAAKPNAPRRPGHPWQTITSRARRKKLDWGRGVAWRSTPVSPPRRAPRQGD